MYVICHFPLFNILSLSLIFASLITMCLSVFLLGVILPGTVSASWTSLFPFPCSKSFQLLSLQIFSQILSLFLPLTCGAAGPAPCRQGLVRRSRRRHALGNSLLIAYGGAVVVAGGPPGHISGPRLQMSSPIRRAVLGLPWWSIGEDSHFNCRGHGFNPSSGN